MSGERKIDQINPLTKNCRETGKTYTRRPEVEAQILENLNLDENEFYESLENLKSETLVYFFRTKGQKSQKIAGKIWEILSEKIFLLVRKYRKDFINEADFEDFFGQIQIDFFTCIGNLENNEGDFAEVSFGSFIKGKILNELRKKTNVQNRNNRTIWLDDDENFSSKDDSQLIAKMTNNEKILILRQAFEKLPREIFEVCYLHYLNGIKIDSKDKTEITLARIFQKSDKTIRNWLKKAEEILIEYRGEVK